ncbi:hypothetical protein DACRYDRAFT_117832 [Dacryopinax primogenitus]|uniref:Uncharacterized protein n=1 Tax=Dacryopinax primogenitus (strain DJM 731) TaxID=1858805 RepID=M5FTZ8_DACPD|nr:uncharacterized protein DACRYDRAFT_117832 [Dacryopinax primogenitus]EJT99633.1 hypothetical protein DACRYDRAFT_117832 [Dacryopinax primogenitus]
MSLPSNSVSPSPPTASFPPYQTRPSLFSPIIIIPVSVTPSHTADQAAAFNEFVPLDTPPPRYNDRFRRPSRRNLRQALERLETTYGPWESLLNLPLTASASTSASSSPESSSLLSATASSSSTPMFAPPRPLPSYSDAYLLPPSYPFPSPDPSASLSSVVPGWDKHPVPDELPPPFGGKKKRRSLLDILMPGLGRHRIFGRPRRERQTEPL